MFDAPSYMKGLLDSLMQAFGNRLVYVGLQGSYLRGEATEHSDIDPMVVIDGLSRADLDTYRSIIRRLPDPENSCGFLCGRCDLKHWAPLEICHLLHTTQDWYGKLSELVPAYTETDLRRYIQMGVGNLFHELCHRYVHAAPERNQAALPYTCKGVFYLLQNLHYLKAGEFAPTHAALLPLLEGQDHEVLALSMRLRNGDSFDFDAAFDLLLSWCQDTLAFLA